jgi:hypothetical protein
VSFRVRAADLGGASETFASPVISVAMAPPDDPEQTAQETLDIAAPTTNAAPTFRNKRHHDPRAVNPPKPCAISSSDCA